GILRVDRLEACVDHRSRIIGHQRQARIDGFALQIIGEFRVLSGNESLCAENPSSGNSMAGPSPCWNMLKMSTPATSAWRQSDMHHDSAIVVSFPGLSVEDPRSDFADVSNVYAGNPADEWTAGEGRVARGIQRERRVGLSHSRNHDEAEAV